MENMEIIALKDDVEASSFNAAEFLENPEEISVFLSSALQTGDPLTSPQRSESLPVPAACPNWREK